MQTHSNPESDVSSPSFLSGAVSGRGGDRASQVVILRNPYHGYMKIATWNIRSLMKPETLESLKREMTSYKVNIIGLTEVRWHGTGDIWSDDCRIIYSGGQESQRGVAFMMDKESAKCVKRVECISDRLMMVQLSAEPVDMMILCVYMPTSAYYDEDVEVIYEQIEDLITSGRGNEYLVIMGDWNAVVGEGKEENVVGSYGLGKRNNRGNMVVDFCKRNKLAVMNTWFKHPERRRYTWKAPGDIRRFQLDYIMIRQCYRNSVKNAHTFPGADVNSDHNLVYMKIRLKLKRLKQATRQVKWNRDALKDPAVREKFSADVVDKIQVGTDSTTEEKWKTLKVAILESAT